MPKKFRPEPYQKEGIKWVVDRLFWGLFWDPGLGKTSTVLHAFLELKDAGEIDSILVVATKRIADKVWTDEIAKWRLPFIVSRILGKPEQRLESMRKEADVYLTNYENLEHLCNNWDENNFGSCMLVCDESTKLKHTNTVRFKALRKKLGKFVRRGILTGTPIPNGMHDLFGQMYVVDQGMSLGTGVTQFRNRWFHPTGYQGYKWELNRGSEEEIYDEIEDRVHRANDSVLDLPDLIFVDRKIRMPASARKLYRQMEKEFITLTESGVITAANTVSARSKLRQIANGNVYRVDDVAQLFDESDSERREVVHLHDEKAEELVGLLEELDGRPALIAYEFAHDLTAIQRALLNSSIASQLPKLKGKPYVPFIGGGTKSKDANKYIDYWNSGSLPVLLGQTSAIAHGLNLQGTNASVVYYGLTDNLEHYEQTYRRVYRKGQEHTVYVFRILAEDTVDEDIAELLKGKDLSQAAMLNAMHARTRRMHG